jgi:hypothetical protein
MGDYAGFGLPIFQSLTFWGRSAECICGAKFFGVLRLGAAPSAQDDGRNRQQQKQQQLQEQIQRSFAALRMTTRTNNGNDNSNS